MSDTLSMLAIAFCSALVGGIVSVNTIKSSDDYATVRKSPTCYYVEWKEKQYCIDVDDQAAGG